ncbi:MAG: hypothetical protein II822_06570 [Prevotella sp.]|nr:hypothetical protein [Prevotella sp.]
MNDIAAELAKLQTLRGIQFVKQLELIFSYGGFNLLKGETAIYSVGIEQDEDYPSL